MHLTQFKKSNGKVLIFPKGVQMTIEETSNGIYHITLFDHEGRSVSYHGDELDKMVDGALKDLVNLKSNDGSK